MGDPAWLAEAPPDDPVEAEVVESGAIVAEPGSHLSKAERRDLALRGLEDEMLEGALKVVGGSMEFVHLDPDDPKKPDGWTDERYRAALAGLKSAKESPVGLKVATQFAVGALRARAVEKAGPRSLNITAVQFVRPKMTYDEVEVDD